MTMRGGKGYTLVELVAVVALVGLLGSFAVPRLRHGFYSDGLPGSAVKIAGLVRELRNEARAERVGHRLCLDLDSGEFWVEKSEMTDGERLQARGNASGLPEGVRLVGVWLRGEAVVGRGEVSIDVSGNGYVRPSAVYLKNDAKEVIALKFKPFLSREVVCRNYVESPHGGLN